MIIVSSTPHCRLRPCLLGRAALRRTLTHDERLLAWVTVTISPAGLEPESGSAVLLSAAWHAAERCSR